MTHKDNKGNNIVINDFTHTMDKYKLCVRGFNEEETMKLFLCRICQDVMKCDSERSCKCGESSGYYLEDGITAVYKGSAMPIGIDNHSLVKAMRMADIENTVKKSPATCMGLDIKAFVMLDCVETILRIE